MLLVFVVIGAIFAVSFCCLTAYCAYEWAKAFLSKFAFRHGKTRIIAIVVAKSSGISGFEKFGKPKEKRETTAAAARPPPQQRNDTSNGDAPPDLERNTSRMEMIHRTNIFSSRKLVPTYFIHVWFVHWIESKKVFERVRCACQVSGSVFNALEEGALTEVVLIREPWLFGIKPVWAVHLAWCHNEVRRLSLLPVAVVLSYCCSTVAVLGVLYGSDAMEYPLIVAASFIIAMGLSCVALFGVWHINIIRVRSQVRQQTKVTSEEQYRLYIDRIMDMTHGSTRKGELKEIQVDQHYGISLDTSTIPSPSMDRRFEGVVTHHCLEDDDQYDSNAEDLSVNLGDIGFGDVNFSAGPAAVQI